VVLLLIPCRISVDRSAGNHFVSLKGFVAIRIMSLGDSILNIQKTPVRDYPEVPKLKAFSWLSSAELVVFSHRLNLAKSERHKVIAGELGVATKAHIHLTGPTNILRLNAACERVAVPPPAACDEVPEPWFRPSRRRHGNLAQDLLEALFSHNDFVNLIDASQTTVVEHLAQFEREHLAVRQRGQLVVRVDQAANSTNMRAA
jgi:hypothetical protein